jgi:hypothetical protein
MLGTRSHPRCAAVMMRCRCLEALADDDAPSAAQPAQQTRDVGLGAIEALEDSLSDLRKEALGSEEARGHIALGASVPGLKLGGLREAQGKGAWSRPDDAAGQVTFRLRDLAQGLGIDVTTSTYAPICNPPSSLGTWLSLEMRVQGVGYRVKG